MIGKYKRSDNDVMMMSGRKNDLIKATIIDQSKPKGEGVAYLTNSVGNKKHNMQILVPNTVSGKIIF